jgi:hypothetical protein
VAALARIRFRNHGDTGVMTFIVAKDGGVYPKNLGAQTERIASTMTTYDSDPTWTKVPPLP